MAPRIDLDYFTLKALLLFPPHAILMRLHGRDSCIVILEPEAADLLGLGEVAGLAGRIHHSGLSPVPPLKLTSMRTIFHYQIGAKELRVRPTPTRFPTEILPAPMDNTPLHSIPSA